MATDEASWRMGYRDAYRAMIRQCLGQFPGGSEEPPDLAVARLTLERDEAVAMLRVVCERYGDNDWPDELHLADVIDKHLGRHLTTSADPAGNGPS